MAVQLEVVVRCKDEYPHVVRTLAALQAMSCRVLFIDSGSTDGSLDVAQRSGVEVIHIAPGSYVPGKVLNEAMKRTTGDVVTFVNADAVPLTSDAVERLARLCQQGRAAAFGRQVPREAARPLTVLDHERAFPVRQHTHKLRGFFSMAASAIRRDVWEALPFDEDLRFSEDVDWTSRLRAAGLAVEYEPAAIFEHSHDYDVPGLERRMLGEGKAEAVIQRRCSSSYWGDLLKPLMGTLLRDGAARNLNRESVTLRWAAQRSRFKGLRLGIERRRECAVGEAASPLSGKYTLQGQPSDEATVQGYLDRTAVLTARELGGQALGILLLGSFGCGEGTVGDMPGGARAALSDIDLVAVTASRSSARALRATCAAISRTLSEQEGVSIDIWPVAQEELSARSGRLMWVDAGVRGARLVRGSDSLLSSLRGHDARSVPGEEWARLLANRATGLALSRLALDDGRHDPVRALHHVAKSWLALGDSVLLQADRYHATSGARADQLERFGRAGSARCRTLAERYTWALAQRAARTPPGLSESAFLEQLPRIWAIHAELEAERLTVASFAGPLDFAGRRLHLYESLADVPRFARLFGGARAASHHLISWKRSLRHPREVLARAAVALAFEAQREHAFSWAKAELSAAADPSSLERALVALREVAA
jgi:molybdopterin-guanine dinucleotide biosynthesis protein A